MYMWLYPAHEAWIGIEGFVEIYTSMHYFITDQFVLPLLHVQKKQWPITIVTNIFGML